MADELEVESDVAFAPLGTSPTMRRRACTPTPRGESVLTPCVRSLPGSA